VPGHTVRVRGYFPTLDTGSFAIMFLFCSSTPDGLLRNEGSRTAGSPLVEIR
jgi:hypothetical protein